MIRLICRVVVMKCTPGNCKTLSVTGNHQQKIITISTKDFKKAIHQAEMHLPWVFSNSQHKVVTVITIFRIMVTKSLVLEVIEIRAIRDNLQCPTTLQ